MRHKKYSILKMVSLSALLLIGVCNPLPAKKLHSIGDSTMQTYDESTDKRGWGQMLQQFFDAEQITVNNRGKSGASSKSFYQETAYWTTLKTGGSDAMASGDILLIQFAHNDEKSSGTDGDEENALHEQLGDGLSVDYRGTTPFDTYKKYLRLYIEEAKAMGVKPVLVAPICRKYFSGNTIRRSGKHDLGDKFNKIENGELLTNQSIPADDHTMDYVYQMQQVANEYPDVPFIDLTTATEELYLSYGEEYCTSNLFCADDSTHPAAMGATLIARLFAQLVREGASDTNISEERRAVLQELDAAIVLSSEISFSPANGDLGKAYVGQTANRTFNVSAFGLTPAEGTVTFTATNGFLISTDQINYGATATSQYSGQTLIAPLYVRYQASAAGTVNGTLTATNGTISSTLPLQVEVATLGGEAFQVLYPLNTDANATVEGIDATAAVGESFSNMEVGKYGSTTAGDMQFLQIAGTDGTWPAGEIDEVSTRYVQWAVQCPEGKKLSITELGLTLLGYGGNGMCAKAYYSTDPTFSTNTQIFEQSGMTNKTRYAIHQSVALTLSEDERVYIRVYPWYNGAATNKWICADSVYVKGQAENAGGVNITGQISYEFIDKEPVFTPEDMQAGFAGKTLSPGDMTISGTLKFQQVSGGEVLGIYTQISNNSSTNFGSTPDAANTMIFTLIPEDGFYFTPSRVSFEIFKHGTGNGAVTAIVSAGEQQSTLCSNIDVCRQQTGVPITKIDTTVSNVIASADAPLKLAVSFLKLPTGKSGGMGNLVIEGTLQGAASSATKYVLTTTINPAEAGTIVISPELGSYKEGTEVTLTAEKNFGFAFQEWQDSEGQSLSTNSTLTVTMDADKHISAIFEAVPVYTVSTSCTNDAERTLGSITLQPNDHNNRYETGTEITAKANESKILTFLSWTDSEENAGTNPTRTLTVDKDMQLVANFEVQDFIAVFDASKVQGYASNSTYPFAADLTWDEQRDASAKIVRLSDGAPLKGTNSTPVVRNREQVVLVGLNGLYQNGYNTTEIAWQYQFSTVGFTSARLEAQMAAKNAASKSWKAQYSLDGTQFTDIEGATWEVTQNVMKDVAFDLPEACAGQATVYVRMMGTGTEVFNTNYPFDKMAEDGMNYCEHSESGFGNLYILGEAIVEADETAPVLTSTLPADNETNVSASGRITFSYDERIEYGTGQATLTHGTEVNPLTATWNTRSVCFDYACLQYGETYTVHLPEGFVQDKSGNAAPEASIRFTIMNRIAPEARTFDAVVDYTLPLEQGQSIAGSEDMPTQFRFIQDAINAAPDNGTKPYLIYIREGYYCDPNLTFNDSYGNYYDGDAIKNDLPSGVNQYDSCRIIWVNKPNIHLIGQDLDKVTIATDRLAGSVATDHSRVWYHVNAGAAIVVTEKGTGFHIENITIDNENWTKHHMEGPQALCLRVRSDKTVFNNVRVRSYQDSYYSASGFNRQFWYQSTIEGAVDFIYGDGEVFFESCTLNINREKGGFIVAPNHKTATTRYGYVFNNTRITTTYAADPSTYQVYFGRPWHDTPYTVFLHTQCEITPYAGYWYPTMGGLPALWAVYDIWDKNGNKMSESSIEDYYYTADGVTYSGKAKNYLTDEEAAQYTISNVMAGDGSSNAETGVWNPLAVIEQTASPVLSANNGVVMWDKEEFAICYVVTVNGKAVAFPTVCEYKANSGDKVSVQSVNEYGSLSAPSATIIVNDETSFNAVSVDPTAESVKKIFRDGQLFILKNGVEYSVLGNRL
ncbi:MAG: pectinesterase family protein [Paludibacteraceae bacterium]